MKRIMILCIIVSVAAAGLLPADENTLPKGADLLEKNFEALGGRDNLNRVNTQVLDGIFEIPAAGISADIVIYSKAPNLMMTVAESETIGKIESGCNGEIAWESTTMTGARVKEGHELSDALREAAMDKMTNWQKYFSSVETIGIDSVNNAMCYKVLMTPKTGTPQTLFIDADSWLIVRVDGKAETPMGIIPVETYLENYQESDGLQSPRKLRVSLMGQERVISVESVQYNVSVPDSLFVPPPAVKELFAQ